MTSQIDLPLSITNEIIKTFIDSDILLSKNTKLAFSRIGGVFIMYISHLAHEVVKKKGKSKISIQDVKEAVSLAGFDDFIPKLDKFIEEYEKKKDDDSLSKEKELEENNDIEGIDNINKDNFSKEIK